MKKSRLFDQAKGLSREEKRTSDENGERIIESDCERVLKILEFLARKVGERFENGRQLPSFIIDRHQQKALSDIFKHSNHAGVVLVPESAKDNRGPLISKNLPPCRNKRSRRMLIVGSIDDEALPHPLKARRPLDRGKALRDSLGTTSQTRRIQCGHSHGGVVQLMGAGKGHLRLKRILDEADRTAGFKRP